MSLVSPHPRKPSDDLDGLLRSFFRRQMPNPWPASRAAQLRAAPRILPSSARRPLIRSRWTLAASIGLLLVGSFLLPGRLAPVLKPETGPGGSHIGTNDLRRQMDKEHRIKEFEDKNKPQLGIDNPGQDLDEFDAPSIR